jgi:tRNA A37 threonylcarbamoyladenosine synthetase subunit TsaC/SUA5/YrdC
MGKQSLAVRIPKSPALRYFLEQTGALMTTSANQPGEPVAETLVEAQAYFGDNVDFYVDGGPLRGRPPSTIVRVVDDAIEIIRQGAVKINENGAVE